MEGYSLLNILGKISKAKISCRGCRLTLVAMKKISTKKINYHKN
jgi:hypothetical protein